MNCPRCNGGCILRTRDHDELVAFREPYACASCGLVFGVAHGQLPLLPDVAKAPARREYRAAS